ncbi:MAG: hypothetical protein HGA19_17015 [Oscillochloris sp.]|nr:hypothetical protein [Oscillochloris sp.]
MHSDLIGKIEKARRYAEEPERIKFSNFKAHFNGGNSEHEIELKDGHWTCTCSFWRSWGTCAHIMAMQRILTPMLTDEALHDTDLQLNAETVAVEA